MKQLKGIDISEWQVGLDYTTMSSSLDFVILREGYRTTRDKMFLTHAAGFKATKTTIKGVYHFIYALNSIAAKEEALSCIRNIEAAGLPKSTYIFADFEYDTVTKAKAKGVSLGPAECRLFTEIFCETIKAAGYPVGVYTNYDYAKNWYGEDFLKKYPVWYAWYNTDGPTRDCLIWQYSSKGRVTGFWENLDMDIWYDAETQQITPEKSIDELAQEVIAGKWGCGEERKNALGNKYEAVQARVNIILTGETSALTPESSTEQTIEQLAREVIAGKYGNGPARKTALGDKYDAVQKKVNELLKAAEASASEIPDRACTWAEGIAADQSHGYSQANRWGPNYDCSSLVISSYIKAGVPIDKNRVYYTGNMHLLKGYGFKDVTSTVNLNTGTGLKRGDILYYHIGGTNGHTAMYSGNGKIVHARGQSYGSSASGDQGTEIAVTNYSRSKWQYVLRYQG